VHFIFLIEVNFSTFVQSIVQNCFVPNKIDFKYINMAVNMEIRYAAHPEDAKHYDTEKIRKNF
jgi:4-deoxy-L-threo-5-hexosulose-uronate ketol-isomerase